MAKPYAVVFAGVPGSSKTIVAQHLSCRFGLPIFSSDVVRSEVKEDLLASNINKPEALAEYEKRYEARFAKLLAEGSPLIFDNSVDRRWSTIKHKFQDEGYEWFMIDMELSRNFLVRLFKATGRQKFIDEEMDAYLMQHQSFLNRFDEDINLRITDYTFAKRLVVSENGLRQFLKRRC